MRFLLLISLLPTTLLGEERTPKEWANLLAERFHAMDSYRATYTASKPGVPAVPGMILEDRRSGAAFTSFTLKGQLSAFWMLPQEGGRGKLAFGLVDGKPFRIEGVDRLATHLASLIAFLGDGATPSPTGKKEGTTGAHLVLSEENLTAGLGFAGAHALAWFDSRLQAQVEETRVEEHDVHFILSDQSWIILDRKNGLLIERGFPAEGGERKLRLESVLPLSGLPELRQEIPKIDKDKIHAIRASESQLAHTFNQQLFRSILKVLLQQPEEKRAAWMEKLSRKLDSYWKNSSTDGLPAGVPEEFGKQVRGKAAMEKLWKAYQLEAPEKFAKVPFADFQTVIRPRLVRMTADNLREKRKMIPSVVLLQQTLGTELKELKGPKLEAGKKIAVLLVTSHIEALAHRILETPLAPE